MKFQTSYKKKLFFYFLAVFVLFIVVIAVVQYQREKQYLDRELKTTLNTYTEIINGYINHYNISGDFSPLDSAISIFPDKDIRITVIAFNGTVLYDNFYTNYNRMENHISRPEIQAAQMGLFNHTGTDIRKSESTRQPFYYFARRFDNYFVRAAVIYTTDVKELLRVDNIFWYLIAVLFLASASVILFVSDTMGNSIVKLRDFANRADQNDNIPSEVDFPENELGEIGQRIVSIYNKLNFTNRQLLNEREKLLNHIQIAKEGIALFSKTHKKVFANNNFIQYLSLMSDQEVVDNVLELPELKPLADFVYAHLHTDLTVAAKALPVKRISLNKNLRNFEVECIMFSDLTYEISISEITQVVKQKKLKQEMTSNIAHELKTPVSSIKGYLETVLTSAELTPEKQRYFLEKASLQTDRLSDLLRDISVLTKIEESAGMYPQESINLSKLVKDVTENLSYHIRSVGATIHTHIGQGIMIKANAMLVFSVFQNLMENSLKYGGENVNIFINLYSEDDNHVNISFADDGPGIEQEHHARIFERFYRVEKGRTRERGGTGLGLAIVKNAIELHGNKIMVKNRKEGGVEFLFSLNKADY